jgi:UDP-MurNAc hydroxylase
MRFQVISHAGLLVEAQGVGLLMDPWIVGSAYWRSWWNYPPVKDAVRDSLRPDYIYLTHVHWDHFQGPSLRRFGKDQRILIPRAPDTRMWRDLRQMGFRNVTEIDHGCSLELAPGFSITSYQFNLFMDSALVMEADGLRLLNANDAKLMGEPLGQIMRRHQRFDFVFRSHSSANARVCFEILDKPAERTDDPESYVRDFADFAIACRCRYAIPFASNHCHLHKDTFHFNSIITTPQAVVDYFARERIVAPEVRIMVSGDSWSLDSGFDIAPNDFFENRSAHLRDYAAAQSATLEKYYAREAAASVSCGQMQRYFARLARAVPWVVRRAFRHYPICYVLRAGERTAAMEVDLYLGTVRELETFDDRSHPIQIHTAAAIIRHCIAANLFAHVTISKRVRYRVTSANRRRLVLFNLLLKAYEYEMLPLRQLCRPRFIAVWLRRWRECALYVRITARLISGRRFEASRYLPSERPARL